METKRDSGSWPVGAKAAGLRTGSLYVRFGIFSAKGSGGGVRALIRTVLGIGPLVAGPFDVGPLDAGPLDAGPLDAGPLDSGPVGAGAGPLGAPDDSGVGLVERWMPALRMAASRKEVAKSADA